MQLKDSSGPVQFTCTDCGRQYKIDNTLNIIKRKKRTTETNCRLATAVLTTVGLLILSRGHEHHNSTCTLIFAELATNEHPDMGQ